MMLTGLHVSIAAGNDRSQASSALNSDLDLSHKRVVYFLSEEPQTHTDDEDKTTCCGVLMRELARQSVLIAARDGIGVITRDMTLGEPVPQKLSREEVVIRITTWVVPSGVVIVRLSMGKDNNVREVWTHQLTGGPSWIDFVATLEKASRDDFVTLLAEAGFQGLPRKTRQGVGESRDADLTEIRSLINQLDNDDYALRVEAHRQLLNLGNSVKDELQTAVKESESREVDFESARAAIDAGGH